MNFNRFILLIVVIIVAGSFLGYSTWNQWNENQRTLVERTGPVYPIAEFNHDARIQAIAFSPTNPDLIVTTGEDYTIKVWDRHNTQAPKVALTGSLEHNGIGDTYSVRCISFSKTGELLIRKINWMLEFWDVSSKKKLNSFDINSSRAAISPTNHLLATASKDVRLWDIRNPNEIVDLFVLPSKIGWEALTHEEMDYSQPLTERGLKHQNETINQYYRMIDISNDGRWIAASGQMYEKNLRIGLDKIKIWDLQNKQLFKIIEGKVPVDFKPN